MAQDLKTFIESNFKILKQCYKSQDSLIKDLINDIQRQGEFCQFTKEANAKLEAEIKNGQQTLISLSTSFSTISTSNIELNKEYDNIKQTKCETKMRTQTVDRKYDKLWLSCVERFESMDLVKQLRNFENALEVSKIKIADLTLIINESKVKINSKREEITRLDQKTVIELAKYLIEDTVSLEMIIKEKNDDMRNLNKNIDLANKDIIKKNILFRHLKEENPLPCLNLGLEISKLQTNLSDSQKEMRSYSPKIQYEAPTTSDTFSIRKLPSESFADAYTTVYRYRQYFKNKLESIENPKKVIVLDDTQINNDQAMEIMSKISPEKTNIVEVIHKQYSPEIVNENINDKEINLPNSEIENEDDMMIPPTQFRDSSQDVIESNETQKKKVTFDLPEDMEVVTAEGVEGVQNDDVEMKKSDESEDEMDVQDEDNYNKLKNSYLKKYNLDLSPKFVYAKKQDLRDVHVDKPIKSKFFVEKDEKAVDEETVEEMPENVDNEQNKIVDSGIPELNLGKQFEDEINDSMPDVDVPESTAGPQLQDSLNLTMNTTDLEEPDIVPCIDSSLLLSPKGDLQTEESDKTPPEGPSFLSGLRKNLSIFGNTNLAEEKPDSSGNFKFDFGGSKKNRGGLFNMFN